MKLAPVLISVIGTWLICTYDPIYAAAAANSTTNRTVTVQPTASTIKTVGQAGVNGGTGNKTTAAQGGTGNKTTAAQGGTGNKTTAAQGGTGNKTTAAQGGNNGANRNGTNTSSQGSNKNFGATVTPMNVVFITFMGISTLLL